MSLPSILFQISAPSFHPKHICMVPSRVGWVKNRGDETGRRLDERDKPHQDCLAQTLLNLPPSCPSVLPPTSPLNLQSCYWGRLEKPKREGIALRIHARPGKRTEAKHGLGAPRVHVCVHRAPVRPRRCARGSDAQSARCLQLCNSQPKLAPGKPKQGNEEQIWPLALFVYKKNK